MDSKKNERITVRVSEQVKETLSSAAKIMGVTLNQFLIQSALEKAKQVIETEWTIHLSKRDAELLIASLDNPPKPNKRLKEAFAKYNEKVG